ncbi:hypothetical protein USDA257_c09300 [Sinorhizobium fredii USDA 257]|uniref:Uncharacterized protein n=1 Tax=Sinorhizobium fredii (strain USDA 257) TaxID=1185652 RepID=I3X0W6_SINF2|nr:hypothetical protein USDA257_c09300 [Sinorhizobium fredii USDA 257]
MPYFSIKAAYSRMRGFFMSTRPRYMGAADGGNGANRTADIALGVRGS